VTAAPEPSGRAVAPPAVPFLDLEPPLENGVREAILADVAQLLETHTYTNGPQVEAFEEAFALYVGVRTCVGVASGLDALRLSLLARGIAPGDEVLVPANAFVATFEAVSQAGAVPVPVDVSENDFNVDVDAVAAAVGPRTRALVPVHLYGLPAPLARLRELAASHGLGLLEDACQAHGAERDGLRAGAVGFAGAFSFYPSKNLGAAGDAGAVVTDDADVADAVRALREHGQSQKYVHVRQGYTARLDTIQAVVLLRKLPHLERWNEERRAAARFYGQALAGVGDLILPREPPGARHVWHLYVARTRYRDRLVAHLRERRIGTGLHYPEPPHLSAAYRHLGYGRGAFPVTERLAGEVFSLPIFPGISEGQLENVFAGVRDYYRRG
jgi:dTDP-3-amino-3,4,6-trideoxy-alpha-D-glucose transaminase